MKLLILETCLVNFGADAGADVVEAPAIIDVTKDTARALVNSGRALYTAKADDPEKGAPNTVSPEMLKAAQAAIAAKAKAAAAPAKAETPPAE